MRSEQSLASSLPLPVRLGYRRGVLQQGESILAVALTAPSRPPPARMRPCRWAASLRVPLHLMSLTAAASKAGNAGMRTARTW